MNNIRTVILLAAMSASLWSCGTGIVRHDDDPTPSVNSLVLRASKTVIEADGTDAVQLEVLADGVPVTEGVRLYDGVTNLAVELPSMVFTTTEPGAYYFWAAYGTAHSEQLKVTAVGFDLPSLPEDPEPDNTSFVRRVLLTQFTGTGCGFCPGMIEILRSVLADEDYASRVVHTAAHTYNNTDPAYLSQRLDQAMGVSGYPTVVADMAYSYSYLDEGGLRDMLDQAYDASAANAGISAATAFADGQLVVMASVKAAVTAEYCIGAWLLEDGIYGKQTNDKHPETWTGDYDTHDNCIRYADSRVSNVDYCGFSLGTVEAGRSAEYVFTIGFEDDWIPDNCHVVVFVTEHRDRGWAVNNVVDVPLNGSVTFEYASPASV